MKLEKLDLDSVEEKVEITDIVITTAGEVFGESANNPEREVLEVYWSENDSDRVVITLPQGLQVEKSDGKIDYEVTDKTAVKRSVNNPNSRFGQYLDEHDGKPPQVGDELVVQMTDKGFWKY